MGGLLLDPVEKNMYWSLSYSKLAVLVKWNTAAFSPICLREIRVRVDINLKVINNHRSVLIK